MEKTGNVCKINWNIIDVRGQVTSDVFKNIKLKINERTNSAAEIIFKMN